MLALVKSLTTKGNTVTKKIKHYEWNQKADRTWSVRGKVGTVRSSWVDAPAYGRHVPSIDLWIEQKLSERRKDRMRQLVAGTTVTTQEQYDKTWDDLSAQWLEEELPERAESGHKTYRAHVGWLLENFGGRPVSTTDRMEIFERILAQGWKKGTGNRVTSTINQIIKWGVHRKLIPGDTPNLDGLGRKENDKTPGIRYTDAQLQRLWQAAWEHDDKRMAVVTALAITTGARRGEIWNLWWEDLVLDSRMPEVHYRKRTANSRKGKTKMAPIPTDVAKLLELYRESAGRQTTKTRLFRATTWPSSAWKQVCEEAKLPNHRMTFHALRHTWTTLALEHCVEPQWVQKIVGHSSVYMQDVYSHLSDQSLRNALDPANRWARLSLRERLPQLPNLKRRVESFAELEAVQDSTSTESPARDAA